MVTVNDYLAQRDSGWMAQVYHFLGLSTAVILAEHSYIYDPKFTNEEHEDERFRHLKPCSRQEATPLISPTAPTTNSASITCATIWCARSISCASAT